VPFNGGPEVQITRNGAFEAFESADGKELLYLKRRGALGVWRVPVDGGEEKPVPGTNGVGAWRSWRVAGNGIYVAAPMAAGQGSRIDYIDLTTGLIREIARMEKTPDPIIPSLTVSADGKHLLFAQFDQRGSNIMMVEGFR